jgi:hypothetical protein
VTPLAATPDASAELYNKILDHAKGLRIEVAASPFSSLQHGSDELLHASVFRSEDFARRVLEVEARSFLDWYADAP